MLHTHLREVLLEVASHEFTPMISTQGAQLFVTLPLSCCLDILEGHRRAVLGGQQHHPHVSTVIINEQEKEAILTWCYRRDRAIEITMYKLQ
jgi:hypothetical protein